MKTILHRLWEYERTSVRVPMLTLGVVVVAVLLVPLVPALGLTPPRVSAFPDHPQTIHLPLATSPPSGTHKVRHAGDSSGPSSFSASGGVGPQVRGTLVLRNQTVISGGYPAANGVSPVATVYDPALAEVLVVNSITDNVSVVADSNNSIVRTIEVGSDPVAATYDAAKGEVFVSNYGSGDISVINTTLDSVVATVPGIPQAASLAYDPSKGEIFVAERGLRTVDVVNDTNDSVAAKISLTILCCGPTFDLTYVPGTGSILGGLGGSYFFWLNDTRNALSNALLSGNGMLAVGYDLGRNEVVVASGMTDNLTFFTPAGGVVANVPVGSGPLFLAYDDALGEVFVDNVYSHNVSVVNDTSFAVVASVPLPTSSGGNFFFGGAMSYDPARGEMFVAMSETNNVSVISDARNSVVAVILSGILPEGIAYDVPRSEIFVASYFQDNVSVISTTTDRAVAQVHVGSFPRGVIYDSGRGDVFVENSGSNNVSVINDTTNSVVANIPVGADPWFGMAYDSGTNEVFVANYGSGNVSVISDVNDTVVANVAVGSLPTGLAYDASHGVVYVASRLTSRPNLGWIMDSNNIFGTGIPLGSGGNDSARISGLAYDPAKGEVFVTTVTYNGPSEVSVVNDTTNTVVSTVPVGLDPEGIVYDARDGDVVVANLGSEDLSVINDTTNAVDSTLWVGATPTFLAYDPAGGTIYCTNPQQGSVSIAGDTNAPPQILSFQASPATLPAGTSTSLSVVWRHGEGTIAYAYAGLPPGCATADRAALRCTPSGPGTFEVRAYVNDSLGHSATAISPLDVFLSLGIDSFTASPTPTTVGSSLTFTTLVHGGAPPVSYHYTDLPSGCASADLTPLACRPTAAGTYLVRVFANDTAFESASSTALVVVSPVPALSVVNVTPSAVSVLVDGSISFSASPQCTGGACPSGTTYEWTLHNGLGVLASFVGTSVTFTAGPDPGKETVFVNGTLNGVTKEATATITISSTPVSTLASVSISPASTSVATGGTQAFTASATCNGGTCPSGVIYAWSLSNTLGTLSSSSGGSTVFTAGSATGTVALTVAATLNGKTAWANATVTITVESSHGSTGFLGFSGDTGYLLVGAILAAVAVVAALVLMRRRKDATPAAPPPTSQQSESPPPDAQPPT